MGRVWLCGILLVLATAAARPASAEDAATFIRVTARASLSGHASA